MIKIKGEELKLFPCLKNPKKVTIESAWVRLIFGLKLKVKYLRRTDKHRKAKWFLIRYGPSEQSFFISNKTPNQ